MEILARDIRFRSFFNHKSIAKEMSEAYSMYSQIKRMLGGFQMEGEEGEMKSRRIREEDIVFVDVCCGKGFNSVLLSMMYPKAQVVMMDKVSSSVVWTLAGNTHSRSATDFPKRRCSKTRIHLLVGSENEYGAHPKPKKCDVPPLFD